MATIRDIAKKSGFSISTVSHALNNRPRVSVETREKIMQIAKELNYIPNSKAISLSIGKSNNLGIVIPYTKANIYYDSIITSIISECFINDYRPTFLPTNYRPEIELEYLNLFAAKEFDGLIFTSAANSYALIEKYLAYGSIVSCEPTAGSSIPSVTLERGCAYMPVIQKLKNQEIKKVACTFSRKPDSSIGSKDIFRVFDENFEHFSLAYTFSNCRDYQDGVNAAEYFFQLDPSLEYIFANSDEIAAGVLSYYAKKKITANPIVVGQNNSPWSAAFNFSSIDFHLEQLGAKAVQLCLSDHAESILIKSEYFDRSRL